MTREQAREVGTGDKVTFGGYVHTVTDVCTTPDPPGKWPFFRIEGEGYVSYRLCGIVTRNAAEYISESTVL